MRQDHAPTRRRRIEPAQLLHEIGIREAVEPVPFDALRRVSTWNRKQLGHSGHSAMERRVEARHLRQRRVPPRDCFDQPDLASHVLAIVRCDAPQFGKQRRRDALGLGMPHAVHDPMPDGDHRCERRLRGQPVQERAGSRAVIPGREAARRQRRASGAVNRERRASLADAIDLAGQLQAQRIVNLVHGEPNARRSAVYREYRSAASAVTSRTRLQCRPNAPFASNSVPASWFVRSPMRATVTSAADRPPIVRIEGIMPLLRKHGRHTIAPALLHRRQNAQLVVDQHIAPRRIAHARPQRASVPCECGSAPAP